MASTCGCYSLLHWPKFVIGVAAVAVAGALVYVLTRPNPMDVYDDLIAGPAAGLASAVGLTAAGPDAPKVGDEAKDFELADLKGAEHKLSDLVKDGPVALVVLRGYPGYQCPLCGGQVAELVRAAGKFQDAKAKVVFVYPGPAEALKTAAAEFAKGKEFPDHFVFLVDPNYTFVNAYGLRWDAKNETAYPSAFVIDGKRKVAFAKVSTTHAGRAKPDELLAALGGK